MDIYGVIIRPIITEKSIKDAEDHKYTFQVTKEANKNTIKQTIESMFKVNVIDVATRIVKGGKKRVGPRRIEVAGLVWKKAIVKLKKDQKIELFEAGASESKNTT